MFFNRLLTLLRKLNRSNHSIYFSREAKKDVTWWLKTLETFKGKLDRFLEDVQDRPPVPGYRDAAEGNSLPLQIAHMRAQNL